MHRDIARLVVLLAVVRVLTVVACPAPAPTPSWLTHREQDWQLKHRVTRRRPATPRPSRDTESGCSRSHDLRDVTPSHAALCRCGLPSGPTTQGPPEPQGTERAPAGGSPLRSPEPHRTPLPSSPAAAAADDDADDESPRPSPAAAAAAAPIGDLDSGGPGGGSQNKRSRPAARSGGRRPQRRGARGRRGKTNGGRRPSVGTVGTRWELAAAAESAAAASDVTAPRAGQGHVPPAPPQPGPESARGGGCRAQATGLVIGALNIQSLKPKLLELSHELNQHQFDVLSLSETWLKPATPTKLLVLPGYSVARADRRDGRGYGGVAIITRDGLSSSILKMDFQSHSESRLESLWSRLRLDRGKQVVIGSLYRPPRHTVAALRADFEDLETQYQRIIIEFPRAAILLCGDLNCDLLKDTSDIACRRLTEFLSDYSLFQAVKSPTYTTGSLLDVCIVNNSHIVNSCNTSLCHFSPHCFTSVRITVPRPRSVPVTVRSRCLKRIDLDAFLADLHHADWEQVFTSQAVSDKWEAFLRSFMPVLDIHAPFKTISIRNPKAPPVSTATRDLMARRRVALAVRGRGSSQYRDINRAVRSAIRRDRRTDIQRRISEQGPTSTWRNLRSVISSKRESLRVQPDTSVDHLNDFFVSVGPNVAAEITSHGAAPELACRLPRVGACAFTVSPITLTMLVNALFSMRSSAACGADGLCVRVLKTGFPAVGGIILHIINTCLATSDYPDSWKHSIIHPIFKSGDPSDPSNFRPISIIPIISKLVERVVQRQLYYYLSSNFLLSPGQHGFRPRHSTETALMTVTDHILSATDGGEISLMCLIDLSKCFDVINHDILLRKLALYGIDTTWFSAYLRGHTQSVQLRDGTGRTQMSPPLANCMGVFQGSALGPLLFTVFANDMSLYTDGALVVQYADDTQLIVSGRKSELPALITRMETNLAALDRWFRANALKVNASKTQLITFGNRQNLRTVQHFTVSFRDAALEPCNEVKNLGLIFDSTLSWDAHVTSISRRCMGTLTGLSHVRHQLPDGVIATLVSALVLSHVRYCLSVYGNGSQKNLDKIQMIINFGARVIFGRRKFDHVSDLRERLGWLHVRDLADLCTLCLTHKVLKSGEPEALASVLHVNGDIRQRSTRQDSLLYVPRSRTEAGKRRFCSRAPSLYNSIPAGLAELGPRSFSRVLKRELLAAATE